MISYVKSAAPSNIALIKYWGKKDIRKNIPAVPSLSLAVDKLYTETEIFRLEKGPDEFHFDGTQLTDQRAQRVFDYLELWRNQGLIEGNFSIRSRNSFPASAGMASSASAFAALAMGLSKFAAEELSLDEISSLARQGSGSAARSIPGGVAAIAPDSENPFASEIISADQVPFGMVAVIVEKIPKKTGSRGGMILSAESSPYYAAWIDQCQKDYSEMLKAVEAMDFSEIGSLAEQNCLAMHACMLASRPALLCWNETTLAVIRKVEEFRNNGLETYFTIDAGPQIFLLGKLEELERIEKRVEVVPGVDETIVLKPSSGAKIIECR